MTPPAPSRYYPVVGPVYSLALFAALVAVAPAQSGAAEFARVDTLNIRFEAFAQDISFLHTSSSPFDGDDVWGGSSIVAFEAEWRRFRFGFAWYEDILGTDTPDFLPIRLGYTIWRRPVGYAWKLQGMVPEVYGRITAYPIPVPWDDLYGRRVRLAGRADIVASADMLGVGIDVSAGVLGVLAQKSAGHGTWTEANGLTPTLDVRFRLLTLSAAFPLRRR